MRDGEQSCSCVTNKLTINNDGGMTLVYRENFAVLQLDFMVATPYPLYEANDTDMHCSNEKGEDGDKVCLNRRCINLHLADAGPR